jgi:hypothetical protein
MTEPSGQRSRSKESRYDSTLALLLSAGDLGGDGRGAAVTREAIQAEPLWSGTRKKEDCT